MAYLGNAARTKEVLSKYNMSAKKKFGQNFLIDSGVLDGIVEASGVTKEDCVLEIGPGIGSLTQYLAEAAKRVVSVEIDKTLIPVLNDTLSEYDNVTIINEDILKVDIESIVKEYNEGRAIKVVANLPYYITTPIIMKLFESGAPIDSITVMVQKEVADRMVMGPGNKDYGSLSLAVGYYAKATAVMNVPPGSFIPQPNVGSAVVHLKRYEKPAVEVGNEKYMFEIIRTAFNQRRKTLSNSLSNNPSLKVTRQQVQDALTEINIDEKARGEILSLTQFARLSDILQR
ncbi:MAG: 16S rRNA (adenine(1518)-N(6)/adenine(1519)-N(6))-dimethyltransferase RsmA [Butyrivibrio sp.]|jgi:16S rRNA (adenine1518-N6/adenine1519-N6)-dimethyltransferase|uniref:Ribosomal RNA small subunit methyltransferase A n=1 Tax=Butyrivibrio hungatei TaxID=185008 RepID=A0A1G5FLK5_9FIRM|nr:16S rRNA (adenine(1518)-N(6)/adenine(1519)-N(6))-dimethyltransferase RsmA [Butyrivibrio hungatei]MBQ4220583.1 16S rRNA (adenine(1518)-N(6)/adenine(1519)-N(6))-dimethyltransferase RsmA [Butyrivibrio sp.]MBR4358180.1 16S rRNA (adenine(1518)-N(6)/adenine(1519)-N(6))-dimethyltransferase RsmA [Butyrivibrio sp.]MBR4641086.1 16S rRNA (adenine(1518)-N(6)/adenine(1519)-N(6))-dimethyltransferase RsmA [Butyrivibrio sp.]MCR4996308.1 16S rRNA (adenine(1518)-N(6)/adenine(1519)-N(6))-dimethyltransferase Rs